MTDIVDWLRRFKTLLITSAASKPEGVAVARIGEAADEIERLRRAEHLLRELTGVRVHYGDVVTELKAEIDRLREALRATIEIAERARLDRPEIVPEAGRRRCGDVIRWKMNNKTVDQIVTDLRRNVRAK